MKRIRPGSSDIEGTGLFAGKALRAGEQIARITGPLRHLHVDSREASLSHPEWIGVGPDLWIEPSGAVRFLNHSCAPNASVTGMIGIGGNGRAKGSYRLVALVDIEQDDEITIDYSLIEGDPLWEMPCACGTSRCRGMVGAVTSLPPERFAAYLPFVPDYFRSLYSASGSNRLASP